MSEVPFTPAEHRAIDAKLADRRPNNAAWAGGSPTRSTPCPSSAPGSAR